MLKKFIAITMALALTLSLMSIVPASADDFGANCWFDAEYKDGSLEDKYGATMYDFSGKDKGSDYDGPAIEIKDVTDDAGKTFKAAIFSGSGLEYLHKKVDGTEYEYVSDPGFEKLNANFTMEMYVKVTNTGWGMIAGTWFNNSQHNNGWGLQMGYIGLYGGLGKANNVSVIDGAGALSDGAVQTSLEAGKLRNKWSHFVLVNENGKNTLYLNGESLGTADAKDAAYACVPDQANSAFRVGSFRPATAQFDITMECAYVRLYSAPATAEQAKAMFDNKLGAAPSGGGSDPAPSDPTKAPDPSTPTKAPKPGDPTDAPAGPTQAPAGSTQAPANPTQAPVNPPKTFDLGIVSIAAMSLSSLVVLKKKKK